MKRRITGYSVCSCIDENNYTVNEIIAYVDGAVLIGKIWAIKTKNNPRVAEKIKKIYLADSVAKLPGAQIYIAFSSYAGSDGAERDYDLQQVADDLLEQYRASCCDRNPSYVDNCSDRYLTTA